jgi:hypothetical protein
MLISNRFYLFRKEEKKYEKYHSIISHLATVFFYLQSKSYDYLS